MPKGIRGQTLEERLMDKIKINEHTDCWEWQAAKNNIGYGMVRKSHEEGMMLAHKAMYEIQTNSTVPSNRVVMHTCSNYLCINPDHLVLATRQDVTDLISKNGRSGLGKKTFRPCKHCKKVYSTAMLARWHDDKCKNKPLA